MTGPESKVGYIQMFLIQKTKVNPGFVNGTNIKVTESLITIKYDHYLFIFSKVYRNILRVIYL